MTNHYDRGPNDDPKHGRPDEVKQRYAFNRPPSKPKYVQVIDMYAGPALVAELYIEHAMIVCTMYLNLVKTNVHAANEFMYGHLLGMTHAALYAEHYPKVTTLRQEDGSVLLRVEQGDQVRVVNPNQEAGANGFAAEMAGRIVSGNKG
jgi:hypothetical protein